jgi:antitoxin VapB
MKRRRRDEAAAQPKVDAGQAPQSRPLSLGEELLAIRRRCAALPDLDSRTPEKILGYDENGLPT